MATNGILSIVNNGRVIFKCVAGCNGMEAEKVAEALKKLDNYTLEDVYETCLEHDFGCKDCLVVQSKDAHICGDDEHLGRLYKQKFTDPKFNPRWERGTAPYVEIIDTTINVPLVERVRRPFPVLNNDEPKFTIDDMRDAYLNGRKNVEGRVRYEEFGDGDDTYVKINSTKSFRQWIHETYKDWNRTPVKRDLNDNELY